MASAFLDDYERLLLQYAAEYAAIRERRANEADMRAFLGGAMEVARFANAQSLDFEGLAGRLMSSSYAPEPGHSNHDPMMHELDRLFHAHAQDGMVAFEYQTKLYCGQLH